MSSATVQQIGEDLAAWLAIARRGETVAIVDDGQEIARLTPPQHQAVESPENLSAVPDFAARLKAIYGERIVWTEAESQAHGEHERGPW